MSTSQNNHAHVRTCIGCGKRDDKSALIRIVRNQNGNVLLDTSGKTPGRGAYVCSRECFDVARKAKKLERALRGSVNDDDFKRIDLDLARVCTSAPTEIEE